MSNKKYFNFPICLLNGFMNNTEAVCNDIIWFVIYAYCQYYDTDEDTACRYFGLNADGAEIPNMYVSRFSKIPQNIPYCGIDKEIIFEYKDSYKSDYDKAVLLAYLAIKSILGEKPYYKLTNQRIIYNRMAGIDDKSELLPKEIAYYCTRSRFDNIKLELKTKWKVAIYANHTRGMYISTKLDLVKLATIAEEKKLSTRKWLQKSIEEFARKQALETISAREEARGKPMEDERKNSTIENPTAGMRKPYLDYEDFPTGKGYNPEDLPF